MGFSPNGASRLRKARRAIILVRLESDLSFLRDSSLESPDKKEYSIFPISSMQILPLSFGHSLADLFFLFSADQYV